MVRLSRIEQCKQDIGILSHIRKNPKIAISSIASHFNLSYLKANRMVQRYVEWRYVHKNPRENIPPGGDQFDFTISQKGIQFLESLFKILQKSKD